MEVLDFLSELKGIDFYYFPNPGNAGDSVIACATYQVFNKLNLKFTVCDLNNVDVDLRGKVVVLGGGGNFINLYPNVRRFFQKYHDVCERIILLPHTVRDQDEIIKSLSGNVTLFAREIPSYDYLSSIETESKCYLDHDMALLMNISEVPDYFLIRRKLTFALFFRNVKRFVRSFSYRLRNRSQDLYVFRGDSESSNVAFFDYGKVHNIDLSQAFAADSMDEYESFDTVNKMISFINSYQIVHTDRLHVCILSALLGKQVKFYANSYDKNKSIYEFSLKDRFDSVEFLGDLNE